MDAPTDPVPLDRLLSHRAWVRRLAVAMAGESGADDLEQEVWLRALRERPRSESSARAWLRTVVRRVASNLRRGEGRRRARDEAAARQEGIPSAAELVAEAESARRVFEAVTELPEPIRSTVVLRTWSDLSLVEVARRTGVPVETARSRWRRGLDLLRRRLGEKEGGRGPAGWIAVLAPLLLPSREGATGAGAVAAAVTLGSPAKIGVAAAVLLLAGLASWLLATPGDAPIGLPEGSRGGSTREVAGGQGDRGAATAPAPLPGTEWRATLAVAVVDTTGRPVAGATALLRAAPTPDARDDRLHPPEPGALLAQGTTSAAGEVRLSVVTAGVHILELSARGHPRRFVDVSILEGEAERRVRIVLDVACALEGRVLRWDGRVVAGGTVAAVRPWPGGDRGFDRVLAEVGRDGTWRLDGLVPGVHDLLYLPPAGGLREGGCVRVPEVARFDMVLDGGVNLRGRVEDAATGGPVAGARIVVTVTGPRSRDGWDGARGAVMETASGAEGAFRLEDLPPGVVAGLSVRASGFAPFPDPVFDVAQQATPLVRGIEVARVVRLRRGATVRGRVLDPEGNPVEGATVSVLSHSAARFGGGELALVAGETTTGADGAYALAGVRPGVSMLVPSAPGRVAPEPTRAVWLMAGAGEREGTPALVEVPPTGEVVRDLVLVPEAGATVLVVDGGGRPVAGARVAVEDPDARSAFAWGSLRVPSGTVSLARSDAMAKAPPREDPADGPSAVTGADGRAVVAGLVPGAAVVFRAEAEGGRRGASPPTVPPVPSTEGRTAAATAGGAGSGAPQPVRIVLAEGGSLSGRMVRADGSVPVRPSLRLVAGARPGEPWWSFQAQLSRQWAEPVPVAEDGSFRVEGLVPGEWRAEATAEGCCIELLILGSVEPGGSLDGLEIRLGEEVVLGGRVVDEAGTPLAGAQVRVTLAPGTPLGKPVVARSDADSVTEVWPDAPEWPLFIDGMEAAADAITGPDGRWRWSAGGAEAGPWRVAARAPGFLDGETTIDGSGDGGDLVLQRGGSISGRVVVRGTDAPAAGLEVHVTPEPRPAQGWTWRACVTDGGGVFRIDGLPPGTWEVGGGRTWTDLGGNCINFAVPHVKTGTGDLLVEVDPGVVVEGEVVDGDGRPVTWGVTVSAEPTDVPAGGIRRHYVAYLDGRGGFRMTVPPGTLAVTAEPRNDLHVPSPFRASRVEGVIAGRRDVRIVVERGASISGWIVYPQDPRITVQMGLDVIVRPAGGGETAALVRGHTQRVESRGGEVCWAFSAGGLEAGQRYDLVVPGSAAELPDGILRNVVAGSAGVIVPLSFGSTIDGTVLDGDGRPLAGVPVVAETLRWLDGNEIFPRDPGRYAAVFSREDGTFTLDHLGPMRFRLVTGGMESKWARLVQPGEHEPGAVAVELRAGPGVSVSGVLRDAAGNPVPGRGIMAVDERDRGVIAVYTSDPAGEFLLPGLTPGPVRLAVDIDGERVIIATLVAPATGVDARLPR